VALGEAAGHGDQLPLSGTAGRTAGAHFRGHMCDAGAEALLLLRVSASPRDNGAQTDLQVVERIAQAVLPSAGTSGAAEHQPPAGHASGEVGEAMVAVGRLAPALFREGQPADLGDVLELVVARAIAAVAHASLLELHGGG